MPRKPRSLGPAAIAFGATLALIASSRPPFAYKETPLTGPAHSESETSMWRRIRPDIVPGGESLAEILGRTPDYPFFRGIAIVDNRKATARLYPVHQEAARNAQADMDLWLKEYEELLVAPGTELWLHQDVWHVSDDTYICGPEFVGHYVIAMGRNQIREDLERLLGQTISIDQILEARGVAEGWEEYDTSLGVYRITEPLATELLSAYEKLFEDQLAKARSIGPLDYSHSSNKEITTHGLTQQGIEFTAGTYSFWWRDGDYTQQVLIDPSSGWVCYQTEDDE